MPTPSPLTPQTIIAVVGTGAMGAGIAQVAATAGHQVKLLDNRPGAALKAIEGLRAQFDKLAEKGKMTIEAAQSACARLLPVEQLGDLADAGLVIEAIVESLEAKQKLFSDLESIVGSACVFGTNTSSISVTAIAAGLVRPERLAGMHFFNPAPLMALVEIVSGLATAQEIADTLFATATAWGKTPVHTKSTPGFIVNRVARPYYSEALRFLHEGIGDCPTIDSIMRDAGGFRMGPFELMDLIGLDINFAVTNSVWQAFFCDPRYTPSLIQQEYVAAGWFGRKSGRGFYHYTPGATNPAAHSEPATDKPTAITLYGESSLANALAERLSKQNVAFSRKPAHPDSRVADADTAVLYLTDGRSATRLAAENAIANAVAVDLSIDYTRTLRLALATAQSCTDEAAKAAIGLLQAAGITVSRLKDAPGLPVMRTLAMLANEASEAVNQGVSDASGINTAMRLGVGYPRGPLEWAETVGISHIRSVLKNLAESYGEDRYRISPLLEQQYHSAQTKRPS